MSILNKSKKQARGAEAAKGDQPTPQSEPGQVASGDQPPLDVPPEEKADETSSEAAGTEAAAGEAEKTTEEPLEAVDQAPKGEATTLDEFLRSRAEEEYPEEAPLPPHQDRSNDFHMLMEGRKKREAADNFIVELTALGDIYLLHEVKEPHLSDLPALQRLEELLREGIQQINTLRTGIHAAAPVEEYEVVGDQLISINGSATTIAHGTVYSERSHGEAFPLIKRQLDGRAGAHRPHYRQRA